MKTRRKLWEARLLVDDTGRQTKFGKFALVGNAAMLQSGAGTNDRVRISEVRRYTPQGLSSPLQDMVAELGAELLPDETDAKARVDVYEALYGDRCCRGFVAMRIEWPDEPETVTKSQDTRGITGSAATRSVNKGTARGPPTFPRGACTPPRRCGQKGDSSESSQKQRRQGKLQFVGATSSSDSLAAR